MQSKLKRGAFAAVVHVVVAAVVVAIVVVNHSALNAAVVDAAEAVVGVGVNDGKLNDDVVMNYSVLYAVVVQDFTVVVVL